MNDWFTNSFQQYSIIWLLISSVLGGIVGASVKFIFDIVLPQKLAQRRDVLEVKRKYSAPILLAADELRQRIENMIMYIKSVESEQWLASPQNYYYKTTLYAVAQFLGWRQILRHEVVYLDFTTTEESRVYQALLIAIQACFSNPALLQPRVSNLDKSEDKWVYDFWLQSIGDTMIVSENGRKYTLNFAGFCKQVLASSDDDLKSWFQALGDLFLDLKEKEIRFRRIVAIHSTLNAFVDYVDPKHSRTERQQYYWDLLSEEEANKVKGRIRSIIPNAVLGERAA